uniref:Uncharacterized protein n=1 Tax=Candidatus Kentrum sp. MB TaxID=2138164 RepID=A0A451BH13_9GAMM|nr:MAG: hypothetical protein BECKMB1821H_GA0114242_11626 [Candidatus Kentron sp. MB]
MELKPIYHCVAAVDVHQAKLTVCVLYEDEAGQTQMELRELDEAATRRRQRHQIKLKM